MERTIEHAVGGHNDLSNERCWLDSTVMFYTIRSWSYTGVSRQPDAIIMTSPVIVIRASTTYGISELHSYTPRTRITTFQLNSEWATKRCSSSISSVACSKRWRHSPLGVVGLAGTVCDHRCWQWCTLRSVWMHRLFIMYLILFNNNGNSIKVISSS